MECGRSPATNFGFADRDKAGIFISVSSASRRRVLNFRPEDSPGTGIPTRIIRWAYELPISGPV